jgi:hypothetical protein
MAEQNVEAYPDEFVLLTKEMLSHTECFTDVRRDPASWSANVFGEAVFFESRFDDVPYALVLGEQVLFFDDATPDSVGEMYYRMRLERGDEYKKLELDSPRDNRWKRPVTELSTTFLNTRWWGYGLGVALALPVLLWFLVGRSGVDSAIRPSPAASIVIFLALQYLYGVLGKHIFLRIYAQTTFYKWVIENYGNEWLTKREAFELLKSGGFLKESDNPGGKRYKYLAMLEREDRESLGFAISRNGNPYLFINGLLEPLPTKYESERNRSLNLILGDDSIIPNDMLWTVGDNFTHRITTITRTQANGRPQKLLVLSQSNKSPIELEDEYQSYVPVHWSMLRENVLPQALEEFGRSTPVVILGYNQTLEMTLGQLVELVQYRYNFHWVR